jgi:hypothetical protein
MTNFDADTLRELRDVQEVAIRTEKHPKTAVVIWVVVADDEVFVRSWRGARGAGTGTSRRAHPPRWSLPAQVGGAGAPGERSSYGRPGQPRIPEEIPAEYLCAGDGAPQHLADHLAARTALICSRFDRMLG